VKATPEAPKEATAEAKPAAAVSTGNPDWNPEQQKQLEGGMREFPASIPVKERWIKISEKVEGKTPKECYERFKEIVELLKKQ
jgi:hypothetical protein